MSLHDELNRIADTAPTADVPHDTWARGRRARRRDLATTGAASVLAVALLVGVVGAVVGVLATDQDQPTAGTPTPGVPNRIHQVPAWLGAVDGHRRFEHEQVSDHLAVGRGAVASTTDAGVALVIGAADGAYHLLDLPGYVGSGRQQIQITGGSALALSPDGRLLAFGWHDDPTASSGRPVPSGVRVVDLVTGDLRSVPVEGSQGTEVDTVVWSPDGRWLAWSGESTSEWTDISYVPSDPVAGRIELADLSTAAVPTHVADDSQVALAVSDRGEVAMVSSNRIYRWRGAPLGTARYGGPMHPAAVAAFTPAGDQLAVAASDGQGIIDIIYPSGDTTPRTLSQRGSSLTDVLDGADSVFSIAGWVDGRHLLLQAQAQDDSGLDEGALSLVDITTGTSDPVARIDDAVPASSLSVAVDLMPLDHPTVSRPAPDWPWSFDMQLIAAGVVVLILAATATLAARRRRRR